MEKYHGNHHQLVIRINPVTGSGTLNLPDCLKPLLETRTATIEGLTTRPKWVPGWSLTAIQKKSAEMAIADIEAMLVPCSSSSLYDHISNLIVNTHMTAKSAEDAEKRTEQFAHMAGSFSEFAVAGACLSWLSSEFMFPYAAKFCELAAQIERPIRKILAKLVCSLRASDNPPHNNRPSIGWYLDVVKGHRHILEY